MIHLSPAKPEEAFELDLREEDAREVSPGWRGLVSLAIESGSAFAGRDDQGRLVGLGGVNADDYTMSPWLLCSPLVDDHKLTALRLGKRTVAFMRRSAGGRLVHNFIPKDAPGNRRFVQALGFLILPSPRDGFDFFFLPPNV